MIEFLVESFEEESLSRRRESASRLKRRRPKATPSSLIPPAIHDAPLPRLPLPPLSSFNRLRRSRDPLLASPNWNPARSSSKTSSSRNFSKSFRVNRRVVISFRIFRTFLSFYLFENRTNGFDGWEKGNGYAITTEKWETIIVQFALYARYARSLILVTCVARAKLRRGRNFHRHLSTVSRESLVVACFPNY